MTDLIPSASEQLPGPAPGLLGTPVPWLDALADLALAAAWLTIGLVLLQLVRRRSDLPWSALTLSAVAFIAASALRHLLDALPGQSASAVIAALEIVAALAAVPTAILLWRALPSLVMLPNRQQLREASESLTRANRELEAFTASVSHDLRSPLTSIAGQAGLLELSLPHATEEQRRRLQRVQGSVKQMSELIDALLGLSRISRYTLHREIVDASALAESILLDLKQKDPQRAVTVTVQPGMTVHGDRRLLRDLFQNLLNNAWKFTAKAEQPRIEIGLSSAGAMATLYVRDNGAGFDMAYSQKLFKPFQRLHGAGEFAGSGVGLATVARIVDRHGGRIWAEAKPHAGAVFYFTLPTLPLTVERLAAGPAALGQAAPRA